MLLATGCWLLAAGRPRDRQPVTSSQRPEACKELNWTKIYHTTFVTFLGDMTLACYDEKKERALSAVCSGALNVVMSPSITSNPVWSLRAQGA